MARKRFTLVEVYNPKDNFGWTYRPQDKVWYFVKNHQIAVCISIDTKCLAENYIQYNYNRIGTRFHWWL